MKKTLLALGVVATLGMVNAETLRIGTEGAYPPWNYIDENTGKLAGYEIDLGNAICERIKYECEFVQNDWDSIIPNLVAGNYDIIMAGMSVTEERKKTISFSDDYHPPEPSRYVAAADSDYNFDNLKGVRIGVQTATMQADYLEENLSGDNTIVTYKIADQSIADLVAGNIDILFANSNYLDPIVATMDDYKTVGPDVAIGGGTAGGMRQADEALRNTINEALTELKAEGVVDKLIAEYFPDSAGPFYSAAQ